MANNIPEPTVLNTVEAHTTPGIYTFLGLATLPRLHTPANNLRILPREMIQRIARFAHRQGYLACWAVGDVLATEVDMTDLTYDHNNRLTMSRQLRSRVTYVEVTLRIAWYGTGLFFTCRGLDLDQFGIALGTGHYCYMRNLDRYLRIRSCAARCWTWRQDPVVFGALVDMDRGCVTFRLNGTDCPCVRFPASAEWREGVRLTVSGLPQPGGVDTKRAVVSCATPPVPPSLLAVAANPLTAEGHLARGTLYADGHRLDQNPDGDY